MKKIISLFAAAAVCGACIFGAVACGNSEDKYTVYAPDGAPALALVNAISQRDEDFAYHIVDSGLIQAQVTGKTPKADFCILPLNLASKLLGNGETYQMLGTVTNGNLYFLTTAGESITPENIQTTLIGKTVGVVQLPNVPGLTLQAVLKDYGMDYQIIASKEADKASDKVNLLAMDAGNVTPVYGCDYYLCPEPAASTKVSKTSLVMAGDLQELYGENGYPQAVLVAKKTVISEHESAVQKMISYLEGSREYLETVQPETVLNLLDGKRTEGLIPAFDANNLSKEVIQNCSVRFTLAEIAKPSVNLFLDKLIAVNAQGASTVSDKFFYTNTQ
ncbi:MAG: hypothetical protein K2G44_04135 [Clostridia bacterium]|nr:hypothetical protein [Clostridia bacterium]